MTAAATATAADIRSSTSKGALTLLPPPPPPRRAMATLRGIGRAPASASVPEAPMDNGAVGPAGPAGALAVPLILGAKGERVTLNAGFGAPGTAEAGALDAGAPLNGDIGLGEGFSEGVLMRKELGVRG